VEVCGGRKGEKDTKGSLNDQYSPLPALLFDVVNNLLGMRKTERREIPVRRGRIVLRIVINWDT